MAQGSKIGFIGLGAMGAPMAHNLVKAGFDVVLYNRTRRRAQALADTGAAIADTPEQLAVQCDLVLTMLAGDAALREVTLGEHGLCGRLGPGGVHVSLSTVAADTNRALVEQHAAHGEQLLAAPVFGRPDAAETAALNICIAGSEAAKAAARPALESISSGLWDYGEEPGAANIVKLAGNFMIAAASEAMGEAYTLCEQHGIDRAAIHELMSTTLFDSPIYRGYGARIAAQAYQPAGFTMPLGLKDMTLVRDAAADANLPMPVADICRQRLAAAINHARDDWDWAGLAHGVSDDAGNH